MRDRQGEKYPESHMAGIRLERKISGDSRWAMMLRW